MAGWLDLKVNRIKGGVAKYGIINPIFQPSPVEPRYLRHLIFEGISVDEDGKPYYLDAHVAYRRACLNAIEYLKKFGYSGEQAYAILGTAPVEGHISGIVDIPKRMFPWCSGETGSQVRPPRLARLREAPSPPMDVRALRGMIHTAVSLSRQG